MTLFDNNILSRSVADQVLVILLRTFALVAGAVVFLIIAFLLQGSLPLLRDIGFERFLSDSSWHPTEGQFNLLPMLYGTLLAAFGAVLISAPIGVFSAIYCHYFGSRRFVWLYRRTVELLAGIPSVVYGFWGLVVLVPLIGKIQAPGASLLAGIIILAIMILPTMAMTADAALSTVPTDYIRGAAALGYSRWTTVIDVILPSIKSTLFTGLILQSGRALGETMAILMVAGNIVQTPESLFDPVRTLTANIALEMAYATGSHRSALFATAAVLIALILSLVSVAEILTRRNSNA